MTLLADSDILVTGGTGSFGRAFVKHLLENERPRKLVIFSRDEWKQYEMQREFAPDKHPCLRYYLGDVRDLERLKQATAGIDFIVHAAAMKQIPAAEYNPFECIKTNIMGSENVITAAIYNRVKRVVALSTDKAVNPVNLYGATKLAADKLFVAANNMSGDAGTSFSIVRYGNVVGSRGSVIPYFAELLQKKEKSLPVTDERMTRFWITLEHGVRLVLQALETMVGGEIFVPKIPSMRITDLAKAMAPGCDIRVVGVRPGEKIHEVLISSEDSQRTVEFDGHYVIQPAFHWWKPEAFQAKNGAVRLLPAGFEYSSDKNTRWLKPDELRRQIGELSHA